MRRLSPCSIIRGMSRDLRRAAALWLCTAALALAPARGASAHGDHSKDHDHDHAGGEPDAERIKKRLERVKTRYEARKRKREQQRADMRRALKKRLGRRLRNSPVTEDVKKELTAHAERVAKIRRIRYVAATKDDFDTVSACDVLLSDENRRHELWWRARQKSKAPEAEK